MTGKIESKKNKKLTDEEKQAWMDSVHFGSCCSDPLPSDVQEADKICKLDSKDK